MVIELGTLAAAARTSLYALKLDNQLFDASMARMPLNPFADRQAQTEGLEMLAGASRGALFTVTGSGEALFDRISSELSGYYLLGVESDPRDRDGKPHRSASTCRARRDRPIAAPDSQHAVRRGGGARRALAAPGDGLGAQLAAALVGAAAARRLVRAAGPGARQGAAPHSRRRRHRLPASKVVSVGYVITDRTGRVVDNKSADMRLLPVMNGVPSALQYTAGASLAPGDYTLKLAVAEGERVGTSST